MGYMTTIQEQEEIDFHDGPRIWDADPDVCCAYFQLGACEHTEAYAHLYEEDEGPLESTWEAEAFVGEEPF